MNSLEKGNLQIYLNLKFKSKKEKNIWKKNEKLNKFNYFLITSTLKFLRK